jgi:hypothetical protein
MCFLIFHPLSSINQSICKGQDYLQSASYVFITLGTAFSYSLIKENSAVANCHKAPKEWFEKKNDKNKTCVLIN